MLSDIIYTFVLIKIRMGMLIEPFPTGTCSTDMRDDIIIEPASVRMDALSVESDMPNSIVPCSVKNT